ncbi:QWRF motif-containing protein 9-like [Rutidosis leptorrhynchoides]|uniref:QWRF motif-containing protein 9-like n=1 Tax=Rutidosis leptorrhynchoides TaxID=125765 RepID=UPI003A9A56E5
MQQKSLYNVWVTVSKLWHSVIEKGVEIQQIKKNWKLYFVLKKHMSYLDNWDLNETDHSIALDGTILALESSAVCIHVISGVQANVKDLEDAFCSAVEVMQAMRVLVSIGSLVTKAEYVNSLAFELANAMKSKYSFLDQCKDLLSTLTLSEISLQELLEIYVDVRTIESRYIDSSRVPSAPYLALYLCHSKLTLPFNQTHVIS